MIINFLKTALKDSVGQIPVNYSKSNILTVFRRLNLDIDKRTLSRRVVKTSVNYIEMIDAVSKQH
jgi:hypothetical protein